MESSNSIKKCILYYGKKGLKIITEVGTAAFLYKGYVAGANTEIGFGVRITSNMIKIILNNR